MITAESARLLMAPKGPAPNKTLQYIGVDFGVAARFTPKSRRFFQWIETRKRNHTLAEVHGLTPQLQWMDSPTSMVQLTRFHGSAFALPSIGLKNPFMTPKND